MGVQPGDALVDDGAVLVDVELNVEVIVRQIGRDLLRDGMPHGAGQNGDRRNEEGASCPHQGTATGLAGHTFLAGRTSGHD